MRLDYRALVLAVVVFMSLTAPAWATRVEPMMYELAPSGLAAQRDVRVENNSDQPIAVELSAERRFIAEDGTETREPADDQFLIFPPQGMVPPRSFQTFRVRYIGDPNITGTQLYVVTIAQLPLESAAPATGVQILVNLGTSVAVSPVNARAQLSVTDVKPSSDGTKLEVRVQNDGQKFARLYDGVWTFSARGQTSKLEGEELRAALSQPLIEARSSRVIILPMPEGMAGQDVSAAFNYAAPTEAR